MLTPLDKAKLDLFFTLLQEIKDGYPHMLKEEGTKLTESLLAFASAHPTEFVSLICVFECRDHRDWSESNRFAKTLRSTTSLWPIASSSRRWIPSICPSLIACSWRNPSRLTREILAIRNT